MSRAIVFMVFVVMLASLVSVACAAGLIPTIGAEEIKMGKEAAKEADKNLAFVEDPELLARVERIGGKIAAVAAKAEVPASYGCATISPFKYSFKIVDSSDVNAFCIPGGHIYVHKGLIDTCETDHELASVLAHEIAHAAHHHMVYLLKEQSRIEGKTAVILVAGLLGSMHSRDMSNVMMGAQFYKTAKISSFGQKAEQDADMTALEYMIQAGYNPVGMLTFLERLAERPELVNWGILQTHPLAGERVDLVKADLEKRGIEINRRAVMTSTTARVDKSGEGDTLAYDVILSKRLICKLKHETSAKAVAERINELLDNELQIREVKVSGTALSARNQVIVEITDEDAQLAGKPAAELASEASDALKRILVKQMIVSVR